ncbi:MAG: D-alanine--D-alanine ligase [Calditrichia bacterium]
MSLKIAVLLGGTSAERDVSIVTGIEIARALGQKGHAVTAIDCAYGVQIISDLQQDVQRIIQKTPADFSDQRQQLDRNLLKTIDFLLKEKFDLIFNALHGGYGENGQLQALLDLVSLPYTGSGRMASALGMDKNLSKTIFKQENIPTADWIAVEPGEQIDISKIRQFGFPLVVKPNDQGSTVGLTIVEQEDALSEAIQLALRYSPQALVEKFIPGREMTVAILGNEPLPVIEIIPAHGIYDYECKYQSGKSQYVTPAQIPAEVSSRLQLYGQKAFRALGCRHYARVDFRLDDEGSCWCLEVNTLPGMTPTSLVPKAARAVGIDFAELVNRIAFMACDQS